MPTFRLWVLVTLVFLAGTSVAFSQPQWGGIVKDVQKAMGTGGGSGPSDARIVEGLKEALHTGTGNAVHSVSRQGGYLNNPQIKIPLPGAIQKVEKLIRVAGFGAEMDAFVLSMNQAAEAAAPQAKRIFWDAIKQMSFADARQILNGADNAATAYFKDKTEAPLGDIFRPIVHDAMGQVGVTQKYQALDAAMAGIPMVGSKRFDLDGYVTSKALDGLFFMIGEEERKIRQNPAARVTDLLKEVFGKR